MHEHGMKVLMEYGDTSLYEKLPMEKLNSFKSFYMRKKNLVMAFNLTSKYIDDV
jgi:hypothetical protein